MRDGPFEKNCKAHVCTAVCGQIVTRAPVVPGSEAGGILLLVVTSQQLWGGVTIIADFGGGKTHGAL